MALPRYIPLRTHTAYSLLEGAMLIPSLVAHAQKNGLLALGLNDTSNLFGAMEFSRHCQASGIQPILGCKLRLWEQRAHLQGTHSSPLPHESPCFYLPLYVKSHEGYMNLSKIVTHCTVGQTRALSGGVGVWQFKDLPTKGLICLSGGPQGPLNKALEKGNTREAKNICRWIHALFPENFYIELSRYKRPGEKNIENILLHLAHEFHLPVVATNEAYFLSPSMYEAHDALMCIAQGAYVNQENRFRLNPHYCLKNEEEMEELFSDIPQALRNTVEIAQRCHFFLENHKPILPRFALPASQAPAATEDDFLKQEAQKSFHKRFDEENKHNNPHPKELYEKRLAYELDMIVRMGFSGYFLIVADFIRWAKKNDIPVGPGRGSGASSLVAWALAITDVDPVRFNLFFERFLNPERVSMPDFDIDFCQERRDEVIHYVQKKYGASNVAHIITFGRLQARGVLRDVGRVLQIPYGRVDKICKRIPNQPGHAVTLEEALEKDSDLKQTIEEDTVLSQMMMFGQQLEGLYRHASTHAAGVVISHQPLETMVPLYQDSPLSLPATQFNMKDVENIGLVKFDFLGLKTLTILQHTLDLLKKRSITLHLPSLPLTDKPTFELLREGNVAGVFQLESAGMQDVLKKLAPRVFEELVALIALYRPGPMDNIPRYLACRNGSEKISYPYACLESILKETFGVMVYQEQVLQIAQKLAGYTLGRADLLRRAMGKKISSEMQAQRKIFIEGVVKKSGGSHDSAALLFDDIAKFSNYAFVKAHAVSYALLLYQTAYLKANHPVEFLAASMNADLNNTDKLHVFAQEARITNVSVLPVDINASMALFAVEAHKQKTQESSPGPQPPGPPSLPEKIQENHTPPQETPSQMPNIQAQGHSIRYGLSAVKNVGRSLMEAVVQERSKGPFKDIYDFVERASGYGLNKRQMEFLIMAGAMDSIHPNRHQLIAHVDVLLRHGHHPVADGLFESQETRPFLSPTPNWSIKQRLQHELEAFGFYFAHHPLQRYQQLLDHLNVSTFRQFGAERSFSSKVMWSLAGVVVDLQQRLGKSGKRYAFCRFSDQSSDYEMLIFSDDLKTNLPLLGQGRPLLLKTEARQVGETLRLLFCEAMCLDTLFSKSVKGLVLLAPTITSLEGIASCLKDVPTGPTTLYFKFPAHMQQVVYRLPSPLLLTVDICDKLNEYCSYEFIW